MEVQATVDGEDEDAERERFEPVESAVVIRAEADCDDEEADEDADGGERLDTAADGCQEGQDQD